MPCLTRANSKGTPRAQMLGPRVMARFRGLSGLPFLCLVCCARFTDQQVETRQVHACVVTCDVLLDADDENVGISTSLHLYCIA